MFFFQELKPPELLARTHHIQGLPLRSHLLPGRTSVLTDWECTDGQIGLSRTRGRGVEKKREGKRGKV